MCYCAKHFTTRIQQSVCTLFYLEMYRSGHNGAHSKCVSPPGHVGSNPTVSAHKKPVICQNRLSAFRFRKMCKNVFIFQKNVLCLPQNLHDRIIMLRIMWEGAARAILDPSAIFLEIPGIPGAVLQAVHGAVAEQAVEICKSLVAREIFTIFILKKTIGIFHLQHSHPSITCKVCALAQICV